MVLYERRSNLPVRSKKLNGFLPELVEDTGLLESIEGAVLRNGAESLAGELHADVAALATVELGNPDALFLQVRINCAVHHLGDVTTDTTLFLSKTGAMNAAALVRHSKRNIADSGHNFIGG